MAGDSQLRATVVGIAAAVLILLALTAVFVAAGPTADDRDTESAQGRLPAPQPEPVLPPTPLKSRTAPLPDPVPTDPPGPTAPTEDATTEADAPPSAPTEPPPVEPPSLTQTAEDAPAVHDRPSSAPTEPPSQTTAALATQSPRLKPLPPPEPPATEQPTQQATPAAPQTVVDAKGANAPTVIRPGASETFGRDVRLHLEPGVLAAKCDGGHYELEWRMASLDEPGKAGKSDALPALPRKLRCRSNRASQAELPARFFGPGAFEFRARHSWPENQNHVAGRGIWSRWRGFQVLPP